MLLKLDINKAYDHVDWDFLMQVLKKFGFNYEWRNMVFACVSTTSFSILMNGVMEGYFPGKRGIK